MNLNGNNLGNVRRDIMNKKRLTDFRLRDEEKRLSLMQRILILEMHILQMGMLMIEMKILVVLVVQMEILE